MRYNNGNNQNMRRYPPQPRRPKRRAKKTPLSAYGYRVVLFLFFFTALSGIFLIAFFFNLTRIKSPPDILYAVVSNQIKDGKEITLSYDISLPYGTGFANGRHYFPINDLLEEMDFVRFGDRNETSFVRSKSDEYIKLADGSSLAYINGEEYYLSGPAFSDGGDIYAPLELLRNVFLNIDVDFNQDKNKNRNKIIIGVAEIKETCFRIRKTRKPEPIGETPGFGEYPVEFKADLEEYRQYFDPPAGQSSEYTALINHSNPLNPPDYIPPDLIDVADTRSDRSPRQLRYYPAKALEAFLIEARANGHHNITVTSAYRDYASQEQLFGTEVARLRPSHGDGAEAVAAISIMPPGHSEHQSGLALDMHDIATGAAQYFGSTPQGTWLAENAHHFGFILRYPEDKTDITGIIYEPWHFRYVGRFHAARMYEMGLCLEEYREQYITD
ncbi:MAG: D-alanyl-D-alanine carboxypeptidase family protein [Oscillospiraceae bacterium]|nr:D-alanyl-D-alanine carboxypeptidase family protein [Oscillospiraceae bacterium]